VLVVVIGLVVGLVCLTQGLGSSLDLALREARDALHTRRATGDIVIAEIDARSLAEINHWPWPRSIHGQVIDRLSAAKARTIAFDVDFSSPSTRKEDEAMALSLGRAGDAVILPTFRQIANASTGDVFENLPMHSLKKHAFLASVNIQPDADGMVRHYETGVVTDHIMRPSIAALLAESSSLQAGNLTIDYSIDPATIPRLSYVDILKGRIPKGLLAGKRVLIGATAVEMGDRYAVPRYGVLAGVIIQALAADTLLQGSCLVNYGGWPLFLMALAMLFISGRTKSTLLRASVLAVGMLIVLLAPLALELSKVATLNASAALATLASGVATLLITSVQRAFLIHKTTDMSTGLPNVAAFSLRERTKGVRIAAAARIQHYGEISLLLGPDQTAEWVRQIAQRLALVEGQGAVYRVEESALAWLYQNDDIEHLPDHFATIAALFRSPIIIGVRPIEIALTFGVAHGEADDPRTLSAQALLAADRAAEQGIVWDIHSDLRDAEVDWKMSLLGELDQAVTNGDLWVAYQPKADVRSGQIVGAEALIRWNHPERGFIAPDHFIPIIEKEGRIMELTLFVMDQALETLESWALRNYSHSIAINISASLLGDSAFFEQAARRIVNAQIDRSRLVLEITESATLADPDQAIDAMTALRALGVGLSIDDYGTGQSTLTYLKRLPVDEIKIDQSFVTDLVLSRNDQILVRSTIALAHDLGFKVVAEGIESAECLALLASYGCDTAQGWHIGKPMSIDAFNTLLETPLAIAA